MNRDDRVASPTRPRAACEWWRAQGWRHVPELGVEVMRGVEARCEEGGVHVRENEPCRAQPQPGKRLLEAVLLRDRLRRIV